MTVILILNASAAEGFSVVWRPCSMFLRRPAKDRGTDVRFGLAANRPVATISRKERKTLRLTSQRTTKFCRHCDVVILDNKIDKKAQLFSNVHHDLDTKVRSSANGKLISVTPVSAFVPKQGDGIFDWPARLIYDDVDRSGEST